MTGFFISDLMSFGQMLTIGALICIALACLLAIYLSIKDNRR